jgi:hypothetical protein
MIRFNHEYTSIKEPLFLVGRIYEREGKSTFVNFGEYSQGPRPPSTWMSNSGLILLAYSRIASTFQWSMKDLRATNIRQESRLMSWDMKARPDFSIRDRRAKGEPLASYLPWNFVHRIQAPLRENAEKSHGLEITTTLLETRKGRWHNCKYNRRPVITRIKSTTETYFNASWYL